MSLIQELKNDIKNKYPDIYKKNNNKLNRIKTLIPKLSFYNILALYVLCIVLVVIYSVSINLEFIQVLTISFEDNIKTFTTGIITLVSMNLFVTNLLFTHLKDERDDIQQIIDKRINFKFITYLGFSIIICVLLLYFIAPTVNNANAKANVLVFIFISFLVYILLLVDLYTTVFNFIHKSKRQGIVQKELEQEFSKAFYNNFLRDGFKKRYTDFIENKKGFTSYFHFGDDIDLESVSFSHKKDKYLVDINMKSLGLILSDITIEEKKYLSLELNQKFQKGNSHDILFFSAKQNDKILDSYIFKSTPCLDEELESENLDRLLSKINQNTLSNRFNDLNSDLEELSVLYMLYINLIKDRL